MSFLKRGKINVVIDLQWGSTGKGLISHYLVEKEDVEVAICNFSPNSAHTSVNKDGKEYIVKQLPQAVALNEEGAEVELMIGADACINPDILEKELNEYPTAEKHLVIHPNAVMITPECIEYEQKNLVRISSTLQGTAAAKAMKLMRDPKVILAKDHPLTKPFVDHKFNDRLVEHLSSQKLILGDFHQGYELSVNSSFYPYCTSSTVNTSQFLSSLNLPPSSIGTVVGVARTFPIRVGNVKDKDGKMIGYSGDVYDDMEELTWEEIEKIGGHPKGSLMEYTTLTKKVRRIFTFSHKALRRAVMVNDVDYLFLNFVNYLNHKVYGKNKVDDLSTDVIDFMADVRQKSMVEIAWAGTGPQVNHVVEML